MTTHTVVRILTVVVLTCPTMFATGSSTMVDDLLREARLRLAPDRRTVVFDVHGEATGTTLVLRGEIHSAAMKEALLRFLAEKSPLRIVDSLVVLPQPSLGERTRAVASISVINMRTKPDHAAEMGTQALLGTPLQVLKEEKGGWFLVQTPDGYLGWTDDRIERMTPERFTKWTQAPKVIVTTEFAMTRHTADLSGTPVSDVTAGAILALKSAVPAYFEVEYPDGRTAFLPRTMAEPLDRWLEVAAATPEHLSATAHRFFGIPYLWGGTSPKGMDCSGFTKTVFFLNGVLLPRDASQQALVGEPVDTTGGPGAALPGDLLFFGFKATGEKKERVTHVALALGHGRFIHSSGEVRENSLNRADADYSEFRDQLFLRARRIIGAPASTGVYLLRDLPFYAGHAH